MHNKIIHLVTLDIWGNYQKKKKIPCKKDFIHCCLPPQTLDVAETYYAAEEHLLALVIDCHALESELRYEFNHEKNALFPHVYGSINFSAIEAALDLPLDETGKHKLPPFIIELAEEVLTVKS